MTDDMVPVEQVDGLCSKCGEPLIDGGVDWYCDTNGCEDKLTLVNVLKAAFANDQAAEQSQAARIAELEGQVARYREALSHIANDRYNFSKLEPLINRLHGWQEKARQALKETEQ